MLTGFERLNRISHRLQQVAVGDQSVLEPLKNLNEFTSRDADFWYGHLTGRRQDLTGNFGIVMSCYWELGTLVLEGLDSSSSVLDPWLLPVIDTAPWLFQVVPAYHRAVTRLSYDDASTRQAPATADIMMRYCLLQTWHAARRPLAAVISVPICGMPDMSLYGESYERALGDCCTLLDDLTLNSKAARRDARVYSLWCRFFAVHSLFAIVGKLQNGKSSKILCKCDLLSASHSKIRKRLRTCLSSESEPKSVLDCSGYQAFF
ncbi:MAG: hypothetical protein KVP17_005230 [Porospora cf. gigantea B]|uniref:uncharacterized protein n=1 Tax=Porospora cf. gigantea B TaxID=2853592 RepID=UPI0035719EB1|nr:MAG: hypothetical protein KVP17_005230 [Porospora cf. gigantea B]